MSRPTHAQLEPEHEPETPLSEKAAGLPYGPSSYDTHTLARTPSREIKPPYPTVAPLGALGALGAVGGPDGDDTPLAPAVGPDVPVPVETIPNRYRWTAFAMIIFFASGSSFAEAVLGPLKSTLLKQLKINNAQYGAIASAENLINTILPIVGGIGMDYWGATYAAIISSVFILIGSIVGAATGHYQLLIAGRIILGLGSTIIESTQNKLLAHWFSGSALAFVFGLDVAWGRVIGILARLAAVPMSQINGFWGWALWIPAILCAVNLGICCLYWYFERAVPVKYQPRLGKHAPKKDGWGRRKALVASLTQLPKFFFIFCGTQLFQNAAVSVWSSNLADMQTKTRGTSTLAAGYNSSLQGIIPIVLTPLAGLFFDRIGYRMAFVSYTALLYVIVFVLMGFTQVHPLAPILLSSLALVTNALPFIASIPVLVGRDDVLGTAFGVWKSFQNCNTSILEVAAGAIQDRTPGETYDRVFALLIAIKSIEVLWGPFYDYLDGRWLGHSLRRPEPERLRIRREALAEGKEDLPGWRVSKLVRGVVGVQLCAMIVTAWTVYIVFSLGT